MKPRPLPPQAHLRECFDYDPDTGVLRWRVRPRSHFTTDRVWKIWNTRYAGTEPMATSGKGYRRCNIDGERFYLHRVIWKWMTGDDPPDEVDHQFGQIGDLRWSELRAATRQQNAWNMRKHIDGRYLKGTRPSPTPGKWLAAIRKQYLGTYDSEEAAHARYCEEAQRQFGEFWRAA